MLNDRDYMRAEEYEPESRRPRTAVAWLILVNVGVLILALLADELQGRSGYGGIGVLQSWRYELGFQVRDLLSPRAFTFFTSMFSHDGIGHLFFNMMMLYVCGREVERLLGPKQFLSLYMFAGTLASLLWFAFHFKYPMALILGASGCISGIMAAAMLLVPNQPVAMLFLPMPLKMKHFVVIGMAVEILMLLSIGESDGVGRLAHVGGFAGGLLYVKLFVRSGPSTAGWKVVSGRVNSTNSGSRIPAATVTRTRAARRPPPAPTPIAGDEDFSSQVDPILDKIGKHGMKSLTAREREVLERARQSYKEDPS